MENPMKSLIKNLCFFSLLASASYSYAAPAYLYTHNDTDLTAGAFVNGTIPPQHPTKPHSSSKIYWSLIKLVCSYNPKQPTCHATIKLGNNNNYTIEIGEVAINLDTGDITPKEISNNGYRVSVMGPGEALITKL